MVSGTVGIAAGYVVSHVERTILVLTVPVPGSNGFQEPVVPSPIGSIIIAYHFQQLIGVGFVVNDLSDLGQSKFLEGEWIILQILVEGLAIHQPHNHTIRDPAHKHVVFLKLGGVPIQSKRTDHAVKGFGGRLERPSRCVANPPW